MSQSKLVSALCDFVKILEDNKYQYCLIGGLAVVVRAYERTTKDIDFAILVQSDKEAEEVVKRIRAENYEIFSLLENSQKKIISTVRLASNTNKLIVDLLFNSCGIEKEIIAKATDVEIFDSIACKVASLSSLLAMKVLSSTNPKRPQDLVDLQYLILEADISELHEAEYLVKLIQERGFDGGVDLLGRYQKFVEQFKNS